MIKSMTGYGKSSLSINSRDYQVEIKAVNHKYIDINIKLPRVISYLEDDIRKIVNSKIKRGKIDISILFENYSNEGNDIRINTELAKMYIQNLKKLADEENISANIEVTEITKFPDVLTIKSNFDEKQIKIELIQAVEDALEQLINMRQNEGNRISQDIFDKILQIEKKNEEIFELSTGLIDEYVVKLEARIKEILKTENLLVKKAIENKVIANNVPFEVMIHVFKTRIITLEELYYKITKETEKYYIQIFDENVSEEKFEIKQIEKTKKNKKIKIFI